MRWPTLISLRRQKASAISTTDLLTTAQDQPQVPHHDIVQTEVDNEPAPHLVLGQRGEALAAHYLERLGYELVAANFKLPVGRNLRGALVQAELDLVAYEGNTLCFVEVKTRASDWYAAPEANVDLRKQRQVARAARAYRRLFGLTAAPHRYDVVSVILPHSGDPRANPRIELLRNFWTDEKFRKRRWSGAPHDF
ncbi:MAG TPA: YraN family protein [Pyrinomonadaceae bacterium]|jgi:putative endonuclease|nr:YraN family protein [Pyrinomonadaceae bacterium]